MFITNIDDYQGDDLIVLTGPPGSRWSSVARVLSGNKFINNSDESDSRVYGKGKNTDGWHRGVYFGPFHNYGKDFDNLEQLSKKQITEEIQKPFSNWNGIKVIKSHWFAYHLPYIRQIFPKCKIIAVGSDTQKAFEHWHNVGGWNIAYPHYEWYRDDSKMLEQIEIENFLIEKFFNQPIDIHTFDQLYNKLELPLITHSESVLIDRDEKFSVLLEDYCTIENIFNSIVRNRKIFIS